MLHVSLERTRFTVQTGHSSLEKVLNFVEGSGRLTSWRLRLYEYAFDLIHCSGIKLKAADALSYLQMTSAQTRPITYSLPALWLTPSHFTVPMFALKMIIRSMTELLKTTPFTCGGSICHCRIFNASASRLLLKPSHAWRRDIDCWGHD